MMTNMPKFGLMVNPWINTAQHMKEIHRNEFDFAELTIEPTRAMPNHIRKNINSIKKAAKLFPYQMVGHTAFWLELGNEFESLRNVALAEFKKAADVCGLLNIEYMSVHATNYPVHGPTEERTRSIIRNFSLGLKELRRHAKREGVKIMLENTPNRKKPLSDFDNYKKIIDKSGVAVHLDVAHAFVIGGMNEVAKYLREFEDNIRHVHLHDNNGHQDEHLPLGKGKIDFQWLVKELHNINYDRTITFEVFTSMKDAVISREKFRRMWMK